MNFEIKDYIVDELNNNELTELIYSLVLYHRDNTIMNDDKFSSRIIRFAYKNVLYDFKQKTILDEKKKKRAEINRQNALKRWGKSVGTIVYTNGNANGDAIAYANKMQKLCKSNANKIANDNANGDTNNNINDKKDKGVIKPIEIPATTVLNTKDDAKDNTKDDAKDMQTNTTGNDAHKKSFKSLMNSFMTCYNEQAQKKDTETSPVLTDTRENDTNIIEEQKDSDKAPIKTIGSLLKDINLPKVDKLQTNANEMQNLCESNANENAIAYANGNAKFMQTECENYANDMQNLCEDDTSDMQDNTQDDVITNIGNPFDIIKEIERESKAAIGNNTFKTEYEIYAESYAKKYNNNMQTECERNANGYANEYANSYANEMQNYANDLQAVGNVNNSKNTIPASDLKPVSYALEKGNILSVDNLLNDDDGSINEETDLSVQKIKEKEKRSKKEKENIYNNIYNNKYIYNNNFKEEKENLIKEKEESILSSNQDVKQAELESDSVSMQKENQKVIQSQPSVQPDASDTKPKRFKAPSVDEVKAYITEKGYSIDAEAFVDYYTSKGWVVGKSPMKDWKAAVRTWNNNNKKFNSSSGSSYYANNRPNRMLTPNEIEAEAYAERAVERLKKQGILTDDNRIKSLEERYGYNEC